MDKTALRKKILTLEGLTNEEKSALLELLNKQKKYGLVWEEKPEDVEERLRDSLPVFKEVKERAILSDSPDAPNHILIEGDNLEALTALSYTHEGKIDVIYIDPPYNTGNKDFIYNDSFVDSEDGYRHSKWLSFMSKRLKIAKRLLSDKGVIFISIDDNEQAQLKLLCDEVFGSINCIGPIIQDKQNAKNDTVNIQKNHEFILCYRNRIQFSNTNTNRVIPNIIVNTKEIKDIIQEGDRFFYLNDAITTRGEGGTLNARPNLGYTFYYNPITEDLQPILDYDIEKARTSNTISEIYNDNDSLIENGYVPIRPPKVRGKLGCWTWDINKSLKEKDSLFIKKTANRYNVIKRTFVPNNKVIEKGGRFFYEKNVQSNSRSILLFSTNDGTTIFRDIMGNTVEFNNPKNMDMIKYFISISSSNSSLVLDFFAGSGTTLHATMQLNSEDGGHRQCILVTNNENKICEEVTYERNKRVINGYTTPKGEEVEGLKNNSLRYYKTELLPREKSPRNMRALMAAATELLCIKEDLYEESKRFGRYRTNPKTIRYFEKGDKRMLIIFCEELADQIAEEIKTLDFGGDKLKIYIFSPDRYAFDDNFYEVQDKVTLVALPAAIYDAYRRVLPKRIDKPLLEIVEGERLTSTVAAGETHTLPEAAQQSIDFNFE